MASVRSDGAEHDHELLFRPTPMLPLLRLRRRTSERSLSQEDFPWASCANCNRTHYEADRLMGVRKPNPKRGRKNMRDSHV
jgi:hypothetical protein